jgi:uncharacterized membrane protein
MRTERYLIVALVLSLVVNGVLAGILVGRQLGREPGPGRLDPMLGMRTLIGALPAERADELRPYYRRYFTALRPRLREIRAAQAALHDALLTEPLDRPALAAALDGFSTELHEGQRRARDALLDLAEALTLEERRLLLSPDGPGHERHHEARPGGLGPRSLPPRPPPHP